jgi:hypothetical protein
MTRGPLGTQHPKPPAAPAPAQKGCSRRWGIEPVRRNRRGAYELIVSRIVHRRTRKSSQYRGEDHAQSQRPVPPTGADPMVVDAIG